MFQTRVKHPNMPVMHESHPLSHMSHCGGVYNDSCNCYSYAYAAQSFPVDDVFIGTYFVLPPPLHPK